MGRQAREVKLDEANKVLFSVPDASYQRTGRVSGFGYPELLCDQQHADILLPFLDASMRKVRKTNSQRDVVKPVFLRLLKFCKLMLAATTAHQEDW